MSQSSSDGPKPDLSKNLPRQKTLSLGVPTVVVDGSSYTITASVLPTRSVKLTYLQLAVRGPGATDLAHSPGTQLVAGVPITLTARATGVDGNFSAYLAYSVDGKVWTDGPKANFILTTAPPVVVTPPINPDSPVDPTPVDPTPPVVVTPKPPTSGRRVHLVGRSGLNFNSIVFRQTPADADAFGARRGVPVDGFLWFTSRGSWADLEWGFDRGYKEWLDAGRLIVVSMPHAPESEGDAMNQRGANNDYANQQKALGRALAGYGVNSENLIIRYDWESNGNWYKWSANRPGGAPALRQSLINFATNLRAGGLTNVRFDKCWNKGPSQAGADFSVFPGAEYCDVVSVDQYDMWSPAYNDSDWARELAKTPSIATVAALAKANGIQWAIDEGGNTHGSSNQGGDNPYYWQAVRKSIADNVDSCAWHNTYDEAGAPATLRHDFNSNPNSFAVYRKLWSPS